jgi:hypothetical protein
VTSMTVGVNMTLSHFLLPLLRRTD